MDFPGISLSEADGQVFLHAQPVQGRPPVDTAALHALLAQAGYGEWLLHEDAIASAANECNTQPGPLRLLLAYAPNAKVRLMEAKALQTALDLLGAEVDATGAGPFIATYSRAMLKTRSTRVLRRRMPDDAAAAAQQLFAVLRELDDQGVKLIWIETPPASAAWDGVRDRLQRAAAA